MDTKDNSELFNKKEQPEPLEAQKEPEAVPSIRPNGDLILIRRLAVNETTSGGLIIPKDMKKILFRAEVLRMGKGQPLDNGEWFHTGDCKVGDIVLVQDDPPKDPRFQGITRHLIPVSPLGNDNFLLCPGSKIYAIELKEEATDPTS